MSLATQMRKIRVDCMLSQQAFAKELGVEEYKKLIELWHDDRPRQSVHKKWVAG